MDEVTYRGYRIEPKSHELRTGGWAPEVMVSLYAGASVRTTPLYPMKDVTFPTREEADRYSIKMAKVWIDHQE